MSEKKDPGKQLPTKMSSGARKKSSPYDEDKRITRSSSKSSLEPMDASTPPVVSSSDEMQCSSSADSTSLSSSLMSPSADPNTASSSGPTPSVADPNTSSVAGSSTSSTEATSSGTAAQSTSPYKAKKRERLSPGSLGERPPFSSSSDEGYREGHAAPEDEPDVEDN